RPASSPSSIRITSRKNIQQHPLLPIVKGRAHQSYRCHARLVQLEAVKKTFYDYHPVLAGCHGAVQVEEDFRFGEAGREPITWRSSVQGTATVGNQLCPGIVDGDRQSPAEESGAAIEADAELQHGGGWDATGRQVGMRAIDTVQDKTQRRNRV